MIIMRKKQIFKTQEKLNEKEMEQNWMKNFLNRDKRKWTIIEQTHFSSLRSIGV